MSCCSRAPRSYAAKNRSDVRPQVVVLGKLVVRPQPAELVPAPAEAHAAVDRMDQFRADELMRVARLLVDAENFEMSALDPRHRADAGPVAVDHLHSLANRREQLSAALFLVLGHRDLSRWVLQTELDGFPELCFDDGQYPHHEWLRIAANVRNGSEAAVRLTSVLGGKLTLGVCRQADIRVIGSGARGNECFVTISIDGSVHRF